MYSYHIIWNEIFKNDSKKKKEFLNSQVTSYNQMFENL